MTAVPSGPLWCWSLLGEDAVFFSQPPLVWEGAVPRLVHGAGSCVARCEVATQLQEYDGSHTTPPIQCGQVAGLDQQGRYLCDLHMHAAWHCRRCDVVLPEGEPGFCSSICAKAEEE